MDNPLNKVKRPVKILHLLYETILTFWLSKTISTRLTFSYSTSIKNNVVMCIIISIMYIVAYAREISLLLGCIQLKHLKKLIKYSHIKKLYAFYSKY